MAWEMVPKLFTTFITNVATVGSAFKGKRKVKVMSLPETIKEKSTFRAKALCLNVTE